MNKTSGPEDRDLRQPAGHGRPHEPSLDLILQPAYGSGGGCLLPLQQPDLPSNAIQAGLTVAVPRSLFALEARSYYLETFGGRAPAPRFSLAAHNLLFRDQTARK